MSVALIVFQESALLANEVRSLARNKLDCVHETGRRQLALAIPAAMQLVDTTASRLVKKPNAPIRQRALALVLLQETWPVQHKVDDIASLGRKRHADGQHPASKHVVMAAKSAQPAE